MPEQEPAPAADSKARIKLTLGDSLGALALLLGLYFVVVVPSLLLKIILLVGVSAGTFVFVGHSHWTYSFSSAKRHVATWATIGILWLIAVPQFVSQWRTEHVKTAPQAHAPAPEINPPSLQPPVAQPIPKAPKPKSTETAKAGPPQPKSPEPLSSSIATGPITQGPCSSLQIGGNDNQVIGGNCGSPGHCIPPELRDSVVEILSRNPGDIGLLAIDGSLWCRSDWQDVLRAANWKIESVGEAFTSTPWNGVTVYVDGDPLPDGAPISFPDNTPAWSLLTALKELHVQDIKVSVRRQRRLIPKGGLVLNIGLVPEPSK